MNLKKDDIFQAFFAAGLSEDYNFLEADLIKLANAFAKLRDTEIKDKVYLATQAERTRCITFVHSLNPDVAKALYEKKGPL